MLSQSRLVGTSLFLSLKTYQVSKSTRVQSSVNKFKLWKVEFRIKHDDQLRNLSFKDYKKLSAINDIKDYWPEKLPKKSVHVIVETPSRKLLWLTMLEESYGKFVYGMYFLLIAWKTR